MKCSNSVIYHTDCRCDWPLQTNTTANTVVSAAAKKLTLFEVLTAYVSKAACNTTGEIKHNRDKSYI